MSYPPGGPAFPTPEAMDGQFIGSTNGMTLRDYFAAKVVAAVIATHQDGWCAGNEKHAASLAYLVADAMLKERNK